MALFQVLQVAVVATIVAHLALSPYTKVEESFNLHAIHDILNLGVFQIESYDHNTFPGAVPRSFIGSLVIAAIVHPIVRVLAVFGFDLLQEDQSNLQFLVRLVIGLLNALLFIHLARTANKIDRAKTLGTYFLLLVLSQFHILYYASRTLPNFLALPAVNTSLSKLLKGDIIGLAWLASTAIILRIEIGVFSVFIALVSSIYEQSNVFINILVLAVGSVFGGLLSGLIDSYFWGYWLIPEIKSLYYNVVQGNASNWGVEPITAYFTVHLPKLFRPPIILALSPIGLLTDPSGAKKTNKVNPPSGYSVRILFVASILFIAMMSLQPHKEWRFIIYTIPVFTLSAANGLRILAKKSNKLAIFITYSLVAVSAALSLYMGFISSYNYPGGEALKLLNQQIKEETHTTVFLDVASRMTGATRFGELHNKWVTYDKTEDQAIQETLMDYMCTTEFLNATLWEQTEVVQIYNGITLSPLIDLANAKKDVTPKDLVKQVLSWCLAARVKDVKELVNLLIVRKDYLYIYKQR